MRSCLSILFFFNAPAPSEIYTLSLHDALPILLRLGVAGNRGGEKSKRSFCKKLPARIWHEPSGDKDRKSTRLNSSHLGISYAVFCLKKKTNITVSRSHSTATNLPASTPVVNTR